MFGQKGFTQAKHNELVEMRRKYFQGGLRASYTHFSADFCNYPSGTSCTKNGISLPTVSELLVMFGQVPSRCEISKERTYALHRFLPYVFYDYCRNRLQEKKLVKDHRILFILDLMGMFQACDEAPEQLQELVNWLQALKQWPNRDYFDSSASGGDISGALEKLAEQLQYIEQYTLVRRRTFHPADHRFRYFPVCTLDPLLNQAPPERLTMQSYQGVLSETVGALSQSAAELAPYFREDVSKPGVQQRAATELDGFLENALVRVGGARERLANLMDDGEQAAADYQSTSYIPDSDDEHEANVKSERQQSHFETMAELLQQDLSGQAWNLNDVPSIVDSQEVACRALKVNVLADLGFLFRRCFRDKALALSAFNAFIEQHVLSLWHQLGDSGEAAFYHRLLEQLNTIYYAHRLKEQLHAQGSAIASSMRLVSEKFVRVIEDEFVQRMISSPDCAKLAKNLETIAKLASLRATEKRLFPEETQPFFVQQIIEIIAMVRVLRFSLAHCCRGMTLGALFLEDNGCSLSSVQIGDSDSSGATKPTIGALCHAMAECLERLKRAVEGMRSKASQSGALYNSLAELDGMRRDIVRSQTTLLGLTDLLSFKPVFHDNFAVLDDEVDQVSSLRKSLNEALKHHDLIALLVDSDLAQKQPTGERASLVSTDVFGGVGHFGIGGVVNHTVVGGPSNS